MAALKTAPTPTLTPEQQFLQIRRARSLITAAPKSLASEKTRADYAQKYTSLSARPGSIWDSVSDTQKSTSYFARRAAVLHVTREKISTILAEQDVLQRAMKSTSDRAIQLEKISLWNAKIGELSTHLSVLESAPTGPAPIANRVQKTTKRRIGNAPENWREKIADRMQKWKPQYLVSALTGCRPAELCTGVELAVKDGFLLARVHGAKITDKSGQKERVLTWPVDHSAPLFKQLLELVKAAPGARLTVKIEGTAKNPGAIFSNAIRDAARREFPGLTKTLTAYSLRHALASDLKASSFTSAEISAALGHLSIDTQSSYGHSNAARGTSLAPKAVNASEQVKGDLKARPEITDLKIREKY